VKALASAPRQDPGRTARRSRELTHYAVTEYFAPAHFFELRIEHDRVLKKWAVPKGLLLMPGEKHLAIVLAPP
jgi:hypothetical protein